MKDLAEQQERALQLLDQLLAVSRDFKDEAFRVRVQAQIAHLLWKYDQNRAQRLLDEGFQAIDSVAGARTDDTDRTRSRMEARYLRTEVLGLLAQHDPGAAEQLLESFAKDPGNADTSPTGGTGQKEEAFLSLQLGATLADTHPERAVQLINNSL